MPGAQPRRSPVERLASSVRRGAPVGAGAPGVSRVQRQGTAQAGAGNATIYAVSHGVAPAIGPDGMTPLWLDLDDVT